VPRALSEGERLAVIGLLHEPRFIDVAPEEIYATLLDENRYVCSARTMYRLLDENGEIRERRDHLRHPAYTKPELLATAPNQLWSWDITKLLGPRKWTYYQLYVIIDVFSRYVVGWMIAPRESAALAKKLIDDCYARERIVLGQLTLHADRGPSMRSKALALMLADLGVTKTHSRPHVSNDNPYSEAHFKTLKYRPDFPARFGCIQDARAFCTDFFHWYNVEHRHSGLAQLTPYDVHHKLADTRVAERSIVLSAAFAAHPERFVNSPPVPAMPPAAAWINKPSTSSTTTPRSLQ
jgi:putative transposase